MGGVGEGPRQREWLGEGRSRRQRYDRRMSTLARVLMVVALLGGSWLASPLQVEDELFLGLILDHFQRAGIPDY
jgi:hypothetical protein